MFALTFMLAGPVARPVAAAGGVTLDARALLAGHGRVGSWMAIAVTVANDGPALTGELRLAGGAQGRTRFGLPVDLPTGSRKTLELYAQPPAFGQFLDVSLVTAAGTAATARVSFSRAGQHPARRRRPRREVRPDRLGAPAADRR